LLERLAFGVPTRLILTMHPRRTTVPSALARPGISANSSSRPRACFPGAELVD